MKARHPTLGQAPLALATLALALWLIAPEPTAAQSPLFQRGQRATVTQHIAEIQVSVEYSRPGLSGLDRIFGRAVSWGELWTPGANMATVLEVSERVRLDGHEVPAGRWSVWMIPSQVGRWEILLDPRDSLGHEQRPTLDEEGQIRFPIGAYRIDPVETLTWSFPRVARDGATLQMSWNTTMVSLELEVDPALTSKADSESRRPPPPPQRRRADDGSLRFENPRGTVARLDRLSSRTSNAAALADRRLTAGRRLRAVRRSAGPYLHVDIEFSNATSPGGCNNSAGGVMFRLAESLGKFNVDRNNPRLGWTRDTTLLVDCIFVGRNERGRDQWIYYIVSASTNLQEANELRARVVDALSKITLIDRGN